MLTFHERVAADMEWARCHSIYTLSRAEEEKALQPLILELCAMPAPEAQAYIRASFRPGTHDSLALAMYKLSTNGDPQPVVEIDKLTIEHNHGVYVLRNVTLEAYEGSGCQGHRYIGHIAHGTVESGGVTNRLFHATSYTPAPVGKPMSYDCYGRSFHCVNPTTKEWSVSCTFCG